MRRQPIPLGLLDEHGPALILPSFRDDCLAPWASAEQSTLADAIALAADPNAATQGWRGRLHGAYFLPPQHGGHPFSVGFNFLLPPPYRVVLLVAVALILFALALQLLDRYGLDLSRLPTYGASTYAPTPTLRPPMQQPGHAGQPSVDLALHHFTDPDPDPDSPPPPSEPTQPQRTTSEYRAYTAQALGVLYLISTLTAWVLFRYWVDGPPHGDPIGRHAQLYQAFAPLIALAILLWPGNQLGRRVRRSYLKLSARILRPSFRQRISFDELLLADTLTSVGKIFGDVWLALCFLLPRNEHHTWYNGRGSWAIPWVHSVPYLIRLRQCLSEYYTSAASVHRKSYRPGNDQTPYRRSRKPLANALKYASSLPVIWFSALNEHANDYSYLDVDARVRPQGDYVRGVRRYAHLIHMLWLLSVIINSLFSFWWDVTNDWGLNLLQPAIWRGTIQTGIHRFCSGVDHLLTYVRTHAHQIEPSVRATAHRVISDAPHKVDQLDYWARRTAPHIQVHAPLTTAVSRVGPVLSKVRTRLGRLMTTIGSYLWTNTEIDPDEFELQEEEAEEENRTDPHDLLSPHAHAHVHYLWNAGVERVRALTSAFPTELPRQLSRSVIPPDDRGGPAELPNERHGHTLDGGQDYEDNEESETKESQLVEPLPFKETVERESKSSALGLGLSFPIPTGDESFHARSLPSGLQIQVRQPTSPSHPTFPHTPAAPTTTTTNPHPVTSPSTPTTQTWFPAWATSLPYRIPTQFPRRIPSWVPRLSPKPTNRPALLRDRQVAMRFTPWVYILAVVVDLVLRFTWSIKMSSHLQHLLAFEGGIALLELGEIVRRFGWMVVRVEWEFARLERAKGNRLTPSHHPDLGAKVGAGLSSHARATQFPEEKSAPESICIEGDEHVRSRSVSGSVSLQQQQQQQQEPGEKIELLKRLSR